MAPLTGLHLILLTRSSTDDKASLHCIEEGLVSPLQLPRWQGSAIPTWGVTRGVLGPGGAAYIPVVYTLHGLARERELSCNLQPGFTIESEHKSRYSGGTGGAGCYDGPGTRGAE